MIEASMESEEVTCNRHAQLLAVIFNANGSEKQSGGGFEVDDFLPESMIRKKEPMTIDEYYARIEAYTRSVGGEVRME